MQIEPTWKVVFALVGLVEEPIDVRLNSVRSHPFQFGQSVSPVFRWHSEVVDRPRNVSERLSVQQELVPRVVDFKFPAICLGTIIQ